MIQVPAADTHNCMQSHWGFVCNRPRTHARTKGEPSRARKCSTARGMHFCDCYQTRQTVARSEWIPIRNLSLHHALCPFDFSLSLFSYFFHSLSLSLSVSLSLSLSLYLSPVIPVVPSLFFVLREISRRTRRPSAEFVAFVFLFPFFFLRILDSPVGHRATKNACLSIRGPRNVRPRATLASWKRKNKTGFVVCTRDYVLGKIFVFVGDRVKHGEYSKIFFRDVRNISKGGGMLAGRQWIPLQQSSHPHPTLVCLEREPGRKSFVLTHRHGWKFLF